MIFYKSYKQVTERQIVNKYIIICQIKSTLRHKCHKVDERWKKLTFAITRYKM